MNGIEGFMSKFRLTNNYSNNLLNTNKMKAQKCPKCDRILPKLARDKKWKSCTRCKCTDLITIEIIDWEYELITNNEIK